MGERAVALCWRPDGAYEQYRSHWGGREAVRSAVLAGTPAERLSVLEAQTWQRAGRQSLATVPNSLDYLVCEVVYLCSPWTVGVALPLWFGLPSAPGTDVSEQAASATCGALVRVTSPDEATRLLQTTRTRKLVASDAVTAGLITEQTAVQTLARSVASRTVGVGRALAAKFRR
ncbi:hypothetical protein [Halovenus marina]|uniref:hypothetical protein n=1 Tax=Halovenus marina TaxID=3396621 RepID=UPI003F542B1D